MGSLTAQTLLGKISPAQDIMRVESPDTLRILAVMVDFQEDKDNSTFGTGKFGSIYSKPYGQTIIDPLPHDKDYFSQHLDFVKNYFRKVSAGKLNITYTVLPQAVTVSKRMREYSPPNDTTNNYSLLASLAKEVWPLVQSQNPGINLSEYDVYTIFHAGVGRDISLPGSFGTEKDLPSLYLGDNSLRKNLNNDMAGMPVNRRGMYNTMFIPETEGREMSDITGGVSLFQISINGLIAANIGSHLGLPDLYDTKTGLSAIGRFGLMDGQSIFAYGGLFPPEPSPWEKMYLGWITPAEIALSNKLTSGGELISLATRLSAAAGDTTVIKIPVTAGEYYLVENRGRDVLKNGSVLTINLGGQTLTRTFAKDTTGFYSYDIDSVKGVVTDVDEFDWALPGNGIVIWHIDENIINAKIAENKVNTDKFRRGVDVEEADGVQDIGEKFTTVFGDEVVGEGTAADFWYRGNDSKLYKNIFNEMSYPPAKTNSGANSNVSLSGFSGISNKMSFLLQKKGTIIQIAEKKLAIKGQVSFYTVLKRSDSTTFGAAAGNNFYRLDKSGNISETFTDFTTFKPASVIAGSYEYIAGAMKNKLNVLVSSGAGPSQIYSLDAGAEITCTPVILVNQAGSFEILAGTTNGKVLHYSISAGSVPVNTSTDTYDAGFAITHITTANHSYFLTAQKQGGTGYFTGDKFRKENLADSIIQAATFADQTGKYTNILLGKNVFYVIGESQFTSFKVNANERISSFSLADLKEDGQIYILFTNGRLLEARNISGVSADNFPVEDPAGYGFAGTPLFAKLSVPAVWVYSKDGRLFGISGNGKVLPGYPTVSAGRQGVTPVLYNDVNNPSSSGAISTNITQITAENNFSVWDLSSASGSPAADLLYSWREENGNILNSSFLTMKNSDNKINVYFPKERAYNWPNPVYGNETNIRYYVSEDSKIHIKIFDLSGGFVAELNADARGGMDNETAWNVSNIQSGVYLARIEAKGKSGAAENSIIKIAVIK